MESEQQPPGTEGVATTQKTFTILEAITSADGATITEITELTELSKSTVYRHLQTLEKMGYVAESDGNYHIGLEMIQIAEQTRNREPGYTIAQRKVFELGHETDERPIFLVADGFEGVYLYRYDSPTNAMTGERRPLHTLASGKTVLAEWSDEKIERFVAETGLESHTQNTITEPDELFEEIEQIRKQGFAVNDQEYMAGLYGVAVPVYTPDDEFLGSLGLFGPTSRYTTEYIEEDLVNRLWDKAGEIKVSLAYD